ncbi:ankyrin [Penicillium tannophilum]|nr:ankyrin [Penicillium tannophilum]
MAYSRFRDLHIYFLDEEGHPEEGHQPAFHDQDGAPLFEDHEFGLLSTVSAQNDVASLHLYNDNPHTTIFQDLNSDAYWRWDYHPFIKAAVLNGFDALHALLDIYVADPTLPEPLEQYLAHIPISLMNMACRYTNRERVLDNTVLAAVIGHASYQMVSRLIAEGADIYARLEGWHDHIPISEDGLVTAMHIAGIYCNLEGMQALIDHPGESSAADLVAIVDSAGLTPLHWALRVGRGDLSLDDKKDQDEITALFHYAVMSYAALESTTLILSAKPLPHIINIRDDMGDTALKKAIDDHAERGGTPNKRLMDLLQVLLENGADGSGCNNKGHNLVHTLALKFADSDPVELTILDRLLEFVNVNGADSYGRTPLHYVARYWSRINFIRRLISQGADVNAVDNKGNTPLHEAMRGQLSKWSGRNTDFNTMKSDLSARARDEVIELLVGAGAAMDHRNAAGKTPPQILDERTRKMKHR